MDSRNHLRWLPMAVIIVLSFFSFSSVFAAEPPKIVIAPVWRPGSTLDSIDAGVLNENNPGDDFRYVDVDIYVTTTVQFWSVQLTCTASPLALTSYNDPSTDGDATNNALPVIWGPAWGSAAQYASVVEPFNTVTGARTITATVLGNRPPLGGNGVSEVLRIATLRYRAKDVVANTAATFTCFSTFLNRNGQPVIVASYTPPPPLPVLNGYALSGVVQYQGRASHAGIEVSCLGPTPGDNFSAVTLPTGAWSRVTRSRGLYTCEFYGNVGSPATAPAPAIPPIPGYQPDRYLAGVTSVNLLAQSYTILPIILNGGNLAASDTAVPYAKAETIDNSDLVLITQPANWNKVTPAGDINGDGRTNQADLAILGTNYNLTELVDQRHVLYSLPRTEEPWHLSRIWLGKSDLGGTTQFITNITPDSRDLWPTVSPDGTRIAFIRDFGTSISSLYVAPIVNGVVGLPVRLTPPNAWYQAFAPSWSPDGTRIAFICSQYDNGNGGAPNGYLANIGDLCLIDATGQNWRDLSPAGGHKAKIFPPAWMSDSHIIYGGSAPQAGGATGLNVVCPDRLCYYNILTNEVAAFDADTLGAAGTIQDMPVIRDSVLFYRFYNNLNSQRTLRYATIRRSVWDGTVANINNLIAPLNSVAPNNFHQAVNVGAFTDIDYYNVSQSRGNILFSTTGGAQFFRALTTAGDGVFTPFTWAAATANPLENMVANPNNPDHTPYDYTDSETGSFVYAYRNTLDWLP